MLESVRPALRSVTYSHIEGLLRFATSAQSGRRFVLPCATVARKEFDWLVIGGQAIAPDGNGYVYPVEVPGEVKVAPLGVTLRFKIIGPQGVAQAYNVKYALDGEKLTQRLLLRNWEAGDRYLPLGYGKPRKLKELFRQKKIPSNQRKLWPVLLCGEQVVWVRGFPPAARVAASPESRRVLIIEEVCSPQG